MVGTAQAGEAVLIFDGRCGFCTRSVEWLMARVRSPVRFEPYQAADLGGYGLSREEAEAAAWWIEPDGTRLRGHRAAGRALVACGGPWTLIGWLARLPPTSWLAALGYRGVAHHRRRLPGTTPACKRSEWNSRVNPSA